MLDEDGLDVSDTCPKADVHSWQKLGQEDDGQWAWRCGNCLEVRHSAGETGGPDPIRAAVIAEAVTA